MTRYLLLLGLFLGLPSLGCYSGSPSTIPGRSPTIPVQGVITLDNEPVADATVMFFCKKLRITSYGKTNENGEFSLTTYDPEDGAPEGRYVVTVKKSEQTITKPSEHPTLPPQSETVQLLPAEYGDLESTSLRATVITGGNNSFPFNLTL